MSPHRCSRRNGHDIDFVVVREGTEGPYVGNGGVVREGSPHEIATEVSVNTAYGVERVVRDAFRRAAARPRRHLTLVHKTNVLVHAGSLWARTVAPGRRGVPRRDAPTTCTSTPRRSSWSPSPERFDVIVTDNLFGDILTDLAAAITGGIGLAASGNLDVSRHQPVDVRAGARLGARHRRHRASPTRPPRSCRWRMLLDHLGLASRGRRGRGRPWSPTSPTAATARRSTARGRRRRRSAGSAPTDVGPVRSDTVWAMSDLTIELAPSASPRSAAERAQLLQDPGFGQVFTDHMVTARYSPEPGWHDARLDAVRAAHPRPGDVGAALRPGDLRGPQGLPPARRLGRAVPAGAERRAASSARPGGSRWPSCPSELFLDVVRAARRGRPRLGADRGRARRSTCGR